MTIPFDEGHANNNNDHIYGIDGCRGAVGQKRG